VNNQTKAKKKDGYQSKPVAASWLLYERVNKKIGVRRKNA
jgi:hypothetical protein